MIDLASEGRVTGLERPDVLVVGSGIAGALAAVAAARKGARVVVVAKPGGATSVSSGAIDVADSAREAVPGPNADPFAAGVSWMQSVDDVVAHTPRHPYARVGAAGRARLGDALALLRDVARDVDLVGRDDGLCHVVATQLGSVKRAALIQSSQALDVGALPPQARLAIVELEDLAGFAAKPTAALLTWLAQTAGRPLDAVPVVVPRLFTDGDVFTSCSDMAERLDDDSGLRARFFAAIRAAVGDATHVLVPPMLGVRAARAAFTELSAVLARPTAELLAVPTSAPGARLIGALEAGLAREGIPIVHGRVREGTLDNGRATSVLVDVHGEAARLVRPAAVVLASGRFFGGGLVRDQVAREVVFGLPVVVDGAPVGDQFIGTFVGDLPEAAHRIFRAGLAVDASLRPRVGNGAPAPNLFAAGSLIEGYDPARDGTAAGVAALTGLLAGEGAASAVRSDAARQSAAG